MAEQRSGFRPELPTGLAFHPELDIEPDGQAIAEIVT
jgi:hypothetical protein